jgi:hypothetical protein
LGIRNFLVSELSVAVSDTHGGNYSDRPKGEAFQATLSRIRSDMMEIMVHQR